MYDEIEVARYYRPRRRPYRRRYYYPYTYNYYYPMNYYGGYPSYYGRPYYNPYPRRRRRRPRRPRRLYGMDTGNWNPDTAYRGGDVVNYNGHDYQAKWWTQGEEPDMYVTSQWDSPWKEV